MTNSADIWIGLFVCSQFENNIPTRRLPTVANRNIPVGGDYLVEYETRPDAHLKFSKDTDVPRSGRSDAGVGRWQRLRRVGD